MREVQTIADRFEIEALRGEFTDAAMMRDWDRFASLFTQDGAWRIPHAGVDLVGREGIRAGIERGQGHWEHFMQTAHPGMVRLQSDTATGRSYVSEFGRLIEDPPVAGGCAMLNTAVEADNAHSALKERAAGVATDWLRLVGGVVKQGVKSGEFGADADPREAASVVSSEDPPRKIRGRT